MRYVSQPIKKLDGMPIIKGKPLYTNDLAPNECLIVLALRSPYAYARIKSIDTSKAMLVKGVECVLTYKDVPHVRFTNAGQTYPECSAYDRLILDEYVRYVGDEVALVAASNEKAAQQALKMIKVEYEVLEPVLDYKKAVDNPTIVHNYDDYFCIFRASMRTISVILLLTAWKSTGMWRRNLLRAKSLQRANMKFRLRNSA